MLSLFAPRLESRPVFHSRNVDETRSFLKTKEFRLDLSPRVADELDVRINGVFMPSMYVGYIQYGPPVTVGASPVDPDHWIQLPLHGQFETTVGSDAITCDPLHGVVLSPTRQYRMEVSPLGGRINLALRADALSRQLAALLGEVPATLLDFAPALNLATGHGRSLTRFVRLAVTELDRADSLLSNAIAISSFEQLLMTGLLVHHPHNYSEALRRRDKPIAPRDVKRAIDFMQTHLDGAIGLPEIVSASGVPGRTLLKHFQDFKGISPIRYLRAARLEKVRDALARAAAGESVTAIAMRWGFTHLGRFSVEYRQRFGETPSETLRRRHTGVG